MWLHFHIWCRSETFLANEREKYILKSNMMRHEIWASEIKSWLLQKYYIKMYPHTTISNGWGTLISRNSLLMLCTWIIIQVYILTLLCNHSEFFIEFYSVLGIRLVTILNTIQIMFLYLHCHTKSSLECDTSIWEIQVQGRIVHHVIVLCFICFIYHCYYWYISCRCATYHTSSHSN